MATRRGGFSRVVTFLRVSILIAWLSAEAESVASLREVACLSNGRSGVCECTSDGTINCAQRELSTVPINVTENAQILNLVQNRIRVLYRDDFFGLEFLRTLYLQDNNIASIHDRAFRNLYRLEILNLERNELTKIEPRWFQHLSFLKRLDLQGNKITQISRYAFLTLPSYSKGQVVIKMGNNPLRCDCEAKALRQWLQQLPSAGNNIVSVENFQCANGGGQLLEVEDSVFGDCSGTSLDVFSSSQRCHTCNAAGSHYTCEQSTQACGSSRAMCLEQINYTGRTLMVSSRCETYESCLTLNYANKETCGVGYRGTSTQCNFCCLGPTCPTNGLGNDGGGRTIDVALNMTYARENLPYQSWMSDPSSNKYRNEALNIETGASVHIVIVMATP